LKTAYFILGMHRSGTSALGGVLNIMGLEFGSDLMKANKSNPKGYFENNFVYRLNKRILSENSSRWDDYSFNISNIDSEKKTIYIKEAKKIIKQEFRYSKKFAIKDPRICLLFPIWEQACLDLNIKIKILLPFRNPKEVALSLKKRDSFSMEKGLLLWTHYFLSAEYVSRSYERLFIAFDDLLGNKEAIERLYTFVEVKKKNQLKRIDEFLDSNIKNNNLPLENFTNLTPMFLQNLIEILKESKFDNLDKIDAIRNDFIFSLEMFHHKELVDKLAENIECHKNLELLKINKNITTVDEAYYLKKYPDLKKYKGLVQEHYFKYGKKEGRYPNEYCESNSIGTKKETAMDEELYNQKVLFEEKYKNNIAEIELLSKKLEEKSSSSEKEKQKLKEIISDKEKEVEALSIELKNAIDFNQKEKKKFEKIIFNKREEIEELSVKIEEEKSFNEKEKQEFEKIISTKREEIKTLSKERVLLTKRIEEEIDSHNKEKQNLENIIKLLKNKEKKLENILQKQEQKLKSKTNSINVLNKNIDELLEDIIKIKKNKFWKY